MTMFVWYLLNVLKLLFKIPLEIILAKIHALVNKVLMKTKFVKNAQLIVKIVLIIMKYVPNVLKDFI